MFIMKNKIIALALAVLLLLCGTEATLGFYAGNQESDVFALNITSIPKYPVNIWYNNLTIDGAGSLYFDVYIDGVLVADDVAGFSGMYPIGSSFKITDINGDLYYNRELLYRELEGTVTEEGVERALLAHLPGTWYVDLNTKNLAVVDVYVNGYLIRQNVFDFYVTMYPGQEVKFTNIRTIDGYSYSGPEEIVYTVTEGNSYVLNLDSYITVEERA